MNMSAVQPDLHPNSDLRLSPELLHPGADITVDRFLAADVDHLRAILTERPEEYMPAFHNLSPAAIGWYFDTFRERVSEPEVLQIWAIRPQEQSDAVGFTLLLLQAIGDVRFADSGIIIWHPEYQQRNIGSLLHPLTTVYAFEELELDYLKGDIYRHNTSSRKAGKALGYFHVKTQHPYSTVTNEFLVSRDSRDCGVGTMDTFICVNPFLSDDRFEQVLVSLRDQYPDANITEQMVREFQAQTLAVVQDTKSDSYPLKVEL